MDFVVNPGLALYLPLHKLDGSSFTSRDAYGHQCTVNGALWRNEGRYFNGTDDFIEVPANPAFEDLWDGGGTVAFWIKPDSDGEGDSGRILDNIAGSRGWIIYTSYESGGAVRLAFICQFDSQNGTWYTTSRVVKLSTFSFCVVNFDSSSDLNNPTFIINGTSYMVGSGMVEATSPSGTYLSDSGNDLYIGNNSTGGGTFDGIIGGTYMYSRILSSIETGRQKQSTKWRYQ